jgi:hypothetical protein
MYHHCTAVLKPIKDCGIEILALNASRDDNERVYYRGSFQVKEHRRMFIAPRVATTIECGRYEFR